MNGRFAPAIVAFGVATATVTHAALLPEFLVQLGDRNLLGAVLYTLALNHFGYAFVLSLCAVLTGGAILLVGWRTRTRGATDWHAALAAALAALCLISQAGVSLNPIAWVCAAALCLVLDRDDNASTVNALAIVAAWSLLQGGATLGALLAVVALAGAMLDARCIDATVRRKAVIAAGACIIGTLQLHAAPWQAYGAHALYLDALSVGAQRERIWSGGIGVPGIALALLLTVAAWYGVRRRGRSADAISFFALLALALADGRNLPYLGIVAAPVVADAVASYYVAVRTYPAGSVRSHLVTYAAAACAFIAALTLSEPKVQIWPDAPGEPGKLFVALGHDRHAHTLLCMEPRWCDGVRVLFPRIRPVLDESGGSAHSHRLQADVVRTTGPWRAEIRDAGVDAIIASGDDDVVSLLTSTGWRKTKLQGTRVLLQPGEIR